MEKIKSFFKVVKDIFIKSCIVFFIMSIFFNISMLSELQSQLNFSNQDKEELISEYGEEENKLEVQIEEQKQKNGDDYPILTMLQYLQYINGANTITYLNIEIAICSFGAGILIQLFGFINKKSTELAKKLKSKRENNKKEKSKNGK